MAREEAWKEVLSGMGQRRREMMWLLGFSRRGRLPCADQGAGVVSCKSSRSRERVGAMCRGCPSGFGKAGAWCTAVRVGVVLHAA